MKTKYMFGLRMIMFRIITQIISIGKMSKETTTKPKKTVKNTLVKKYMNYSTQTQKFMAEVEAFLNTFRSEPGILSGSFLLLLLFDVLHYIFAWNT